MQRGSLAALFLTGLMVLSGCFGAVESGEDGKSIDESLSNTVQLEAEWGILPESIPLDGTPVQITISVQSDGENWGAEPTIITPETSVLTTYLWEVTVLGLQLTFTPATIGEYSIRIQFTTLNDAEFIAPLPEDLLHTFSVVFPEEDAPILSAPITLPLNEATVIWFEGSVNHSSLSSCTLQLNYGAGLSKAGNVKEDGTWKVLIDLSEVADFLEIQTIVECGEYTRMSDTVTTQVVIDSTGDDADGDGIPDLNDLCPNGYGASNGWSPSSASDQDNDGCHDFEEDLDDDNDGILDVSDLCPTSFGWISTPDADYDSDGCHD
ncbi:MAG: MSCRAMM family adhesin SdrC, partial [Candidatus Poseidoniaceae archaeon]|nr:MSCRAMM family adhesin SdrC [Candidatus Poseidoniaceae archaeon]